MLLAPESDLRVSLVQADTVWRDAAANRSLYGGLVRPLAGVADLVVLPETFTSGFGDEAIAEAETMHGAGVAWLRALADEVGAVVTGSMVIAGLPGPADERPVRDHRPQPAPDDSKKGIIADSFG